MTRFVATVGRFTCLGLSLGLSLGGCQKDGAQLLVRVGSDLGIPEEIGSIGIEVLDGAGAMVSSATAELVPSAPHPPEKLELPFSFAVVPLEGDVSRQVTIQLVARAHAGGEPRIVRRATTGFMAGQSRRLDVFLARSCVEVWRGCAPGTTCTEHGCAPEAVDPASLPMADPGGSTDFDVPPSGGSPDASTPSGDPPGSPCVPAPEIPADGIDQDCDGVDTCFEDLDGDDHGTPALVLDDDLDCANDSRLTSRFDTDCDDSDRLVYPGQPCTDGESCTLNDLCVAYACRGHATRDCVGCTSACPETCTAGECCTSTCSDGACPACGAGCSCSAECVAQPGQEDDADEDEDSACRMRCGPGASCQLAGRGTQEAELRCERDGNCALECTGTVKCRLTCDPGAGCLIGPCVGESCVLDCPVAPQSCPGNIRVCNRACP